MNTGINVESDVIENGDNIKTSIKKNTKKTLKNIGSDALEKARKVQAGNGNKKIEKKSIKKNPKRTK